jgi:hypothetical protein
MAKARKSASAPKGKYSHFREVWWRIALHATIFIIFVSAAAALIRLSQIYVDRRLAFPTRPPKVVLANRPPWMSDFLADEIITENQPVGLHSAFDKQLLIDTSKALLSSPWIKRVNQVRRTYVHSPGDTLEIDCEFRAPAALVKWGDYFWLVDSQGVKLPEQYTAEQLPKILTGADGKMNIRIIDGIAHAPCESGQVWLGDDLAGGLEMAGLVSELDWADQIRTIDVSNFGGRRDPGEAQVVLVTRFGTQLRWGRAPSSKDSFVEVAPAQKLDAIEAIYREKKRVDAGQPWIDVRFDRVTCPGVAQNSIAQVESQASAR